MFLSQAPPTRFVTNLHSCTTSINVFSSYLHATQHQARPPSRFHPSFLTATILQFLLFSRLSHLQLHAFSPERHVYYPAKSFCGHHLHDCPPPFSLPPSQMYPVLRPPRHFLSSFHNTQYFLSKTDIQICPHQPFQIVLTMTNRGQKRQEKDCPETTKASQTTKNTKKKKNEKKKENDEKKTEKQNNASSPSEQKLGQPITNMQLDEEVIVFDSRNSTDLNHQSPHPNSNCTNPALVTPSPAYDSSRNELMPQLEGADCSNQLNSEMTGTDQDTSDTANSTSPDNTLVNDNDGSDPQTAPPKITGEALTSPLTLSSERQRSMFSNFPELLPIDSPIKAKQGASSKHLPKNSVSKLVSIMECKTLTMTLLGTI